MNLQQTIDSAVKEFDENVKSIAYVDYSKDRLGCCGGDYCEGNHNDNIKDFLISSIKKAVGEATKELDDAAEMLWVVLANVSGGDWTKQSEEWQEAARRWADNYHKVSSSLKEDEI